MCLCTALPSQTYNSMRSSKRTTPFCRLLRSIGRSSQTDILQRDIKARVNIGTADLCCGIALRRYVSREIDKRNIRYLHFGCPYVRTVVAVILGNRRTHCRTLDVEVFESEILYNAPAINQ